MTEKRKERPIPGLTFRWCSAHGRYTLRLRGQCCECLEELAEMLEIVHVGQLAGDKNV